LSEEVSPSITGAWASDYLCCYIIPIHARTRACVCICIYTHTLMSSQYTSEYGHIQIYLPLLHRLAIQSHCQSDHVLVQVITSNCTPMSAHLIQTIRCKYSIAEYSYCNCRLLCISIMTICI
jgi:hypothetical protein